MTSSETHPTPAEFAQPVEQAAENPFTPMIDTAVRQSLAIQPGELLLVYLENDQSEACTAINALAEEIGFNVVYEVREPRSSDVRLEQLEELSEVLKNGVPENTVLYKPPSIPMEIWQHYPLRDKISAIFQYQTDAVEARNLIAADKVFVIREGSFAKVQTYNIHPDLQAEWNAVGSFLQECRVREKQYVITRIPSEGGAEPFGFESYEAYLEHCLQTANRDWERVNKAQRVLVEKLAQGSQLSFSSPAGDGLDERWGVSISMDISGKRFVNSTIGKNVPGSEVFSSPTIDSVNGHFSLPYPFLFKNEAGQQITLPSILFDVHDGEIDVETVEIYDDPKDPQSRNEKLTQTARAVIGNPDDPGMRRFGEIGIGTNPNCDKLTGITLFDEKALGFHLAIGRTYNYTTYVDMFGVQEVVMDNGNEAGDHIDLVRMGAAEEYGMLTISLDGETLFDNGQFVDPQLAYLHTQTK